MYVVYEGPFAEVEVPHDVVAGGTIAAVRGKVVDVPDEVGESLLTQGEESADQIPTDANGDPVRSPQHDRPWRKATAKETAAYNKENSGVDAPAEEGDPA